MGEHTEHSKKPDFARGQCRLAWRFALLCAGMFGADLILRLPLCRGASLALQTRDTGDPVESTVSRASGTLTLYCSNGFKSAYIPGVVEFKSSVL